jgi:hypothetical protein
MTETRKIAAILVSDVVGCSRRAGRTRNRKLSRLRGHRQRKVTAINAVTTGPRLDFGAWLASEPH